MLLPHKYDVSVASKMSIKMAALVLYYRQ